MVKLKTVYAVEKSIFDPLTQLTGDSWLDTFENKLIHSPIDWAALVGELVSQLGDLGVVHSSPATMKIDVENWVKLNHKRWRDIIKTLCFDYNPISNYDRVEKWEDVSNSETHSKSVGNSTAKSDSTGTSKNTEKTAGYNTNDLSVKGENAINDSAINNSNNTHNGTVDNTGKVNNVRTGRAYGNIGVTTTQEMIEAERKLLSFKFYHILLTSLRKDSLLWFIKR